MASLFILGDTLIDREEYEEKMITGQIDDLLIGMAEKKTVILGLQDGNIHATDPGNEVDFQPIGIGKPLSVEIMTLYSGDFIANVDIPFKLIT